jgi:hypothetical protein
MGYQYDIFLSYKSEFPFGGWRMQHLDCRDFFQVNEGFRKSEDYAKLQKTLQRWSEDVAAAIEKAPRWRKEWLTASWLDVATQDLMPKPSRNFALPGL